MKTQTRWMRVVLLLSVVVCAGVLSSCGRKPQNNITTDAMTVIRASGIVKAGWAPYPPYAELDPATHRPRGFYIDLFNRVAKEAGYKVEWVETSWGNLTVDLQSGRFQVMAAPVFRTIPRATQVAFTRPIDYFGLSAVTRANDKSISRLEDLRRPGLTAAVTQGEVGQEYASRNLPNAKLRVFNTGDIALALNDVIDGRADVGIADSWTIRQFVAHHPGTVRDVFPSTPFNQVGAGWSVSSSDTQLIQFLNTAIDWMASSGTINEIASHYQLPSKPADQ